MADRTTHHSPFHLAELRDSLCPPSKKIARTLGAQAGKSYISRNKNTFYHEASAFTPPISSCALIASLEDEPFHQVLPALSALQIRPMPFLHVMEASIFKEMCKEYVMDS